MGNGQGWHWGHGDYGIHLNLQVLDTLVLLFQGFLAFSGEEMWPRNIDRSFSFGP